MKTLKNILKNKLNSAAARASAVLRSHDGQFVVDHAVVFVIIIVLGGIALTLLRTFVSTDLGPLLTEKIKAFFN